MKKHVSLAVRRGLALAICIAATATPTAATPTTATQNGDAHVHSAHATTTVASAEPDRSATLDRANPTFTWESSWSGVSLPGYIDPMFRCTDTPSTCEYILFNVESAGELKVTLDHDDLSDIDGFLYRSNAAGETLGMLTNCVVGYSPTSGDLESPSSETCKAAVERGFYVLEVEYGAGVEGHYIGTAELGAAAPGPPGAEITLEGCKFTLYYFKDSAERLQAYVPSDYRLRPYPVGRSAGSATIAAAAYDCDRIEVPGSSPAPGTFTVLSVLVHPPDETYEGPNFSDFYVLWIHANNPQLVELLASRGMPAHLVPGMLFEKPLQSLAVRVEVPWSPGAYELATTGPAQGVFHSHDNAYLHVAAGGRLVRMDFVTGRARDQFCPSIAALQRFDDHHAVECGKLTAQAGTPVADFFGAPDRTALDVWDHDPVERSWLQLSVTRKVRS